MKHKLILGIALFLLLGGVSALTAVEPTNAPATVVEPEGADGPQAGESLVEAPAPVVDPSLEGFIESLTGSVAMGSFNCPGNSCDFNGECRQKLSCVVMAICEGNGPGNCDGECVCCD